MISVVASLRKPLDRDRFPGYSYDPYPAGHHLLWIAAIATFVFAEKLIPLPDSALPARLTGGAMILGGSILLVTWALGGG